MDKISKEDFIEKSNKQYNSKYDYSEVEYKNTGVKVKIICPEHGEFWKTPYNHLLGQGCAKCKKEKNKKDMFNSFVSKCKELHGDKYDYSKVVYENSHKKVCIICPEHGEFWQTPSLHLQGCGCPKCKKNIYSTETFIAEARKVHGDKYDYSKVVYEKSDKKVCIVCPTHGEFWQTPNGHITAGHDCPKCAHPSTRKTREEFIKEAIEKHGTKYIYSKVDYETTKTKVCIICPEHGEFWQMPLKHLSGHCCPFCAKNKKMTREEFIKKANYIHNNFYDYSKVDYKNTETKVCIICPEHGEFWQTPHSHLQGIGCPICSTYKNINETRLFEFLDYNIENKVERIKRFPWLGLKSLDIFIPDYNIAIEYQGSQHFRPNDFFGGDEGYKSTVKRDKEKYDLCKLNGVKLFYFSNEKELPLEYFDVIFNDKDKLLYEIRKYIKKM